MNKILTMTIDAIVLGAKSIDINLDFLKDPNQAVLAGGSIRDYVLDKQPKDWDFFVFNKAAFDSIPVPVKGHSEYSSCSYGSYGSRFEVKDIKINDYVVQIICHKDCSSVEQIFENFDFTINCCAYEYGKEVVVKFPEDVHNRKLVINCVKTFESILENKNSLQAMNNRISRFINQYNFEPDKGTLTVLAFINAITKKS